MKKYFFAAFVLASRLFFVAPLNTYFQNIHELNFQYSPLLISLGVITAIFVLIFSLVPFILFIFSKKIVGAFPARLIHALPTLYVALAVLFWVQSRLLAIDIGFFSGRPVDWSQYTLPLITNSLFWTAALLAVFRLHHRLRLLTVPLAVILLIMQSAGLVAQALASPSPAPYHFYQANPAHQFTFSPEKNIIFIILDTFQSDVFEAITLQEPDVTRHFPGFTYFKNTAGVFQATTQAMPLILTGKPYDNQIPFQTYLKSAFTQDGSLPQTLIKEGYHVYLNCNQFTYCSAATVSDLVKRPQALLLPLKNIKLIFKPTIIRNAPSLAYWLYKQAKAEISHTSPSAFVPADESDVYFRADQHLLANIQSVTGATSPKPAFRIYHFTAPHPPLYLNAQGEYQRQEDTYQGLVNHSRGALIPAIQILDKLKALEIYDQSLIVIMADHGYGPLGYKPDPSDASIIKDPVISAGLPLLLIKPFNAFSPYKVDPTPVTQQTLAQDIINYVENDQDFTLTLSNVRFFYHYNWDEDHQPDYLPPFKEYLVTGFVRDQSSWSKNEN